MTKLNELACQILEAKYYQPGETCPEDVFERVATVVSIPDVIDNYIRHDAGGNKFVGENLMAAFGQYEYLARRVAERRCLPILNIKDDNEKVQMLLNWVKEKDKYYIAMCNLDFLPATPTLMNAGAGGMLSSCFAIRVEDTMEDIFQAVKEVAIISQRGGGVGLDVSPLRGEGSPVGNKKGVSSGPISFLKVFNETGNQVLQGGGRRCALLAGLRIDHPDILKFIHCKEREGELSNFNMSVFVPDYFMLALKEDKEIELVHPKSKDSKKIRAKELWNEIVKNAWKLGDPGIIFQDRINKDDPVRGKYGNMLTNPCVTKDTWVFTGEGARQVKDLINIPFEAIVNGRAYKSNGFFKTGNKNTIKIVTKAGYAVTLTNDHKVQKLIKSRQEKFDDEWVRTFEYEWAKVEDLSVGDKIRLQRHDGSIRWGGAGSFEEGYVLGLIYGDGFLTKDCGAVEIWKYGNSFEAMIKRVNDCIKDFPRRKDFKGFRYNKTHKKYSMQLSYFKILAEKFGMGHNNKKINYKIEESSYDFYIGFLQGAFDADGSVQGTQKKGASVRFSQSCLEDLYCMQRMLLRLGIQSKIYKRKEAGTTLLPDGKSGLKEYKTKSMYELIISGIHVKTYNEKIGFVHECKKQKLENILCSYKRKMNDPGPYAVIKSIENSGIQDVYDTQVENIKVFDGNGFYLHNCGEIPLNPYSSCNLASINLTNFVGDNKHFSFKRLGETVKLVTRFLDNIIDINNYPLDKITEMTLKIRPIGLGIMGLHDTMLALGIEYGSEFSLTFIDKIYEVIKPKALETSIDLGKKRGIPEDLKEYNIPRRNGTLLTVPPTGTISIIANQVSSGIEPVFQWEYTRKDSYGEHKMRHWLLEEYGSIDKLPPHAKTALEIAPEAHVKVQARVQHFLDSSVSKTVNLPNSYTVEDVDKIYRMAYDLGCKSITVYRTGSRKEEVLIKTEEKKEDKKGEQVDAIISKAEKIAGVSEPKVPPRPAVLFGCTYCIRTSLGKVYITINEDKHGVREVFITLSKAGSTMNAHCSVEGRMISNQLKYGVPLQSIINHLKDTKDIPTWWNGMQINSVPDAVAKALEDYLKNFEGFSEFMEAHENEEGMQTIQNAEEDEVFDPCPDCGNPLKHEGGCKSCSCGYSACG